MPPIGHHGEPRRREGELRHHTTRGSHTALTWARTTAAAVATAMVASACAGPIVGVGGPGGGGGGDTGGQGADPPPVEQVHCEQPAAGEREHVADPEQVALDPQAIDDAISYASGKGAQSVRIYRHGCLVGRSWNDPAAERSPMASWSMTKGVVAVVVGRAVTLGRLGLDDPIGAHLPGLSPQHGAITVRHLLNQTSGLRFAWANDLNDATHFDSAARALQRPFEAAPGEQHVYAQTTVTALVAVVEAAVGEDFQQFADREVFGPIGIERSQWRWQRDGSGRTQGFAFLDMSPLAFGRLGSLLLADGHWRGAQLIDPSFIDQGRVGSDADPGYGFLWRTNAGERHRQSSYAPDDWLDRRWMPAAPVDTYGMSGMFEQNVFVVPSLDMVVVRMGLPHALFYDPIGQVGAKNPDWSHRFFRILMAGVTDVDVPDPGEWAPDPDLRIDPKYVLGLDLL